MKTIPVLSPDLQIGFHFRLKNIKDLYFHEAISKTIQKIPIARIDAELNELVPPDALQKLMPHFLSEVKHYFLYQYCSEKTRLSLDIIVYYLGFLKKSFTPKDHSEHLNYWRKKGNYQKILQRSLMSFVKV